MVANFSVLNFILTGIQSNGYYIELKFWTGEGMLVKVVVLH